LQEETMNSHVMISVAIMAAAGTIASPSTTAAQTDAINGAWRLNRELSDDFQQKTQEAREARGEIQSTGGSAGGGRQGGGGHGGGGRGGGGGVGVDFSDAQRAEAQEFRKMAAAAIEQFEFGAAQGMVAFRYADGRSRLLKADGEPVQQRVGPDETIELYIKAEWDKEKLEVEREIRSSGKIKEVYWLNDAGQLIVDTEVEMGRGGMRVEFRRVYDPLEG
jgi:hypothetical protein